MGRSASPDPRAYVLSQRYTASELLTAKQAAAEAGMPIADWIRHRTQVRIEDKAPEAPRSARSRQPPPVKLTPDALQELRKAGVNLKQIAHQLNAHKLGSVPQLHDAVTRLSTLIAPIEPDDRSSVAKRAGGPVKLAPLRLDPGTLHELRNAGVVINQIAHQLNAQNLGVIPEIPGAVSRLVHLIMPIELAVAERFPATKQAGQGDGS